MTLSLLLALLRAKVDIDSVGREAAMGAAAGMFLSGDDSETECMVEADGFLLCPDEAALRRDALLLRRSCRPRSPTVEEMLWREACLRFGGVVGTLEGGSYWLVAGGGGDDGACSWNAGRCRALEREPLLLPPKKDGRRLKTLLLLLLLLPGSMAQARIPNHAQGCGGASRLRSGACRRRCGEEISGRPWREIDVEVECCALRRTMSIHCKVGGGEECDRARRALRRPSQLERLRATQTLQQTLYTNEDVPPKAHTQEQRVNRLRA